MSLETHEINGELYYFGRVVAPLLATDFTFFDRLHHDHRDIRKRVPFLTDFGARVRKVKRSQQLLVNAICLFLSFENLPLNNVRLK